MKVCDGLVDRFKVLVDDCFTAFPVGLFDTLLNLSNSFIARQDTLIAKKQVCMMVLIRTPMPVSLATSCALIT